MERLSNVLNLKPKDLTDLGIVNPYVDFDIPLYIHPILLMETSQYEFANSINRIQEFFSKLTQLIDLTMNKNISDPFYKAALDMFDFPETDIKTTGLGLSKSSIDGKGLTGETARKTLNTIYQIVESGVEDYEILRMLAVFQENVGVDRISDMITTIIFEDILEYTQNRYNDLKINNVENYEYKDKSYKLYMRNEKYPYLLLPEEILSEIPVATSREDIDKVVRENELIRKLMDEQYVESYKEYRKLSKKQLLSIFLKEKPLFEEVIQELKKQEVNPYDFNQDKLGVISVVSSVFDVLKGYTFHCTAEKQTLMESVKSLVMDFKDLVELKNLKTELYNRDKVRHESTSHKLFYPIPYMAKKLKLFDFTFESNVGNGPVEFRFSNLDEVVVVEFKFSSHPKLVHGYNVQLQDYMDREKSELGIYVIIDVEPGKDFTKFYEGIECVTDKKPYYIIDGKRTRSSSKL
jgi:hypothetical protein